MINEGIFSGFILVEEAGLLFTVTTVRAEWLYSRAVSFLGEGSDPVTWDPVLEEGNSDLSHKEAEVSFAVGLSMETSRSDVVGQDR
jgi:hypothetical protein